MRGVRLNILDVKLHQDSVHRGNGQVMPMSRRVVNAAFLLASPTLQEPVYQGSSTSALCPLLA